VTEIAGLLSDAIRDLGFSCFVLRETPPQVFGAQPNYIVDKTPPGWRETYIAEGFYKKDHVVRFGRHATRPFLFEEAPYTATEETEARRLLNAVRSAGITPGIFIPTTSWRTRSPANAILKCDDKKNVAAIADAELILLYATHKLRSIVSPQDSAVAPQLSPREREVLKWTADGKTAWEIGEILHISENVVNKFIAHAMSKLDAVSKPQAVANALRVGEIDF
jgi:LuxR family quorum sensing-dependent transcriptional regulator